MLAALLALFTVPLIPLEQAAAGVGFGVVPDFPTPVTVGQTGLPGTLTVTNVSDGTQAVGNVTLNQMRLVPSCSNFAPGCAGGTADPNTFTLSATGTGTGDAANPNACTGRTFNLVLTNPATGERQFQPANGAPVVLGPPSLANDLDVCQIAFTFNVNKVPNHDSFPGVPGVQTNQIGFASGTHQDGTVGTGSGSDVTTVLQATPGFSTEAVTPVTLGEPISDTAFVTGPAGSPAPTGTVTFTLYGPDDPNCAGPPVFDSGPQPVAGGPPTATAVSGDFTPTAAGSYNWVATYSGDANYQPATSPCGAPNETSVVNRATVTIATQATPSVNLGQSIQDVATVTSNAPPPPQPTFAPGGVSAFAVAEPTGTVTFTLFGPDNPTCAGSPIFTSANRPLGGGPPPTATSEPFTPPQAGTYRWIASYSGDANYAPATTACNEPNESSVVNAVAPTVTTQATPSAPLGQPVSDTATVTGLSGGPAPTGTVTFRLFDNPTCTGAPVFTSANRPLSGGPPSATATSDPFVPQATGSYYWTASYSGDANYTPVNTACNDPNEVSVITAVAPAIATNATPTAAVGQPITDTATVTGPANAPAPTGTVTFTLFGPNDPNCTGAPVFTSASRPLGGGPPPTATSEPFTPMAAGEYRWIASYSGDANYTALTSPCNAPNETSVVTQAVPTIATTATPAATLGQPITDTATVTGAPNVTPPTGTVTFTVFGPDDPNCTGAPVFTSANRPLSGGPPPTATSAPFTPTAPGTYRWIASYSGDTNYTAVTSACNDANETSVVTQAVPTIATTATPAATLGQPISDTATVTGAPNVTPPTGTVTFTVFGPDDPNCTGAPVFTSANRPLGGGPPPTATSAPFTPPTVGSYRWIASYSGDANYAPVTSACNDPNETSVVGQATPGITTSAIPSAGLGQPISDTATVTGVGGAAAPTGTVTFTVFGPNDPSCTGAPVFTSANRPLGGGPPPTATSEPFTPVAAGEYRWIASYSGDANYAPVTSPCNAPNEISVVAQATPGITTSATPAATLGQPITDTATVTGAAGAPAPTGTVTFTVFGPDNQNCTGTAIFTSANRPLGGGPPPTATSEPFTPMTAGEYRWVASYSGDANYTAVTSPCNAPDETSVVGQATPGITTSATPAAPLGQAISDTATVTGIGGGPAPTGTVTFTLFGPDNPTCTGTPVFTSANRPLSGGPPPTATSGPFTPSAPGEYRWVAVYSGDANYTSATSPCNAANETTVVAEGQAVVTTSATPTATLGQPVSDVATVTGPANAPAPTGTVNFSAFGPDNPNCTGTPVFTSDNRPLAGGPPPTAISEPFTPTSPGAYRWVATYSGDANYAGSTTACNDPNETSVVSQADVTVATQATPTALLGQPITDTATVTGPANAPAPTGTVTFTVFGPNDPNCTGTPVFTSANRPVAGGPPPLATSAPFTPAAAGEYRWIASYSGDANYTPVTTACNDLNETSVVPQAAPTVTTQATPSVMIGQSITDTATVTGPAGAPAPTGTVTFTVFGPDNPTCSGPPVFTSANRPLSGGPPSATATSEPFTPTAVGAYRWVAAYSGDANYTPVTTACNDPDETSTVNQAGATLTTLATPTAAVGQPISDTATVTGATGAPAPTGTVTFTVFGPDNPTCTGAPAFTSANRPLSGGPPPTATSAPFTPAATGQYLWVATYSGDLNYTAVISPCGAPGETSVVQPAQPAISTQATPSATLGQSITDVATVTGVAGAPAPTGTVTFTVFGPDNPTCTGAPAFTSANRPLSGGPPPTATSAPFTPTAPGTYRWVAVYSGDAAYGPVTSPCNAPNESTLIVPVPMIEVTKTPDPTSRPEPGGTFTFTVVVTNTSSLALTLTSLSDDVYGNLAGKGTCALGATLVARGGTYTCSFPGDFFGNAGATQTDTVTATGTDEFGQTATDTAQATVTITNVVPSITVTKIPNPTSRPEPGGTFTFTVVVINTSPEPLSLTSLTDDIYGDLNGKGTCGVTPSPLLAASGGAYSCSFEGTFSGRGGDSQTDTVTATGRDDDGTTVTARASATVTLTNVPPAVAITKTPDPASRPEPGGTFTFRVVVTNTSSEPVTITSLVDDIYGDLAGKGTCATGTALAPAPGPGNTYTCSFEGEFRGAGGASQTDTVTVVVTDRQGSTATAQARATVTLTTARPPLARTGGDLSGPARLAATLVVLGLLMVGIAWRSQQTLAPVAVPVRRGPWPPEPPAAPSGPMSFGPGPVRPRSGPGGAALTPPSGPLTPPGGVRAGGTAAGMEVGAGRGAGRRSSPLRIL